MFTDVHVPMHGRASPPDAASRRFAPPVGEKKGS